ncbi:MAG: class I SAM-dependent methyltransferase [Filifactor alocis]|nr:class I SAM-dependent methyltransferase [Filifactor alocis]
MNRITNLNDISLILCERYMPKVEVAVDITLGNGLDVEKFLPYIGQKLIAIDIQQEAIDNAKSRLEKTVPAEQLQKVEFVHDTHTNIDKYVEKADLIFGNLGYLPNSNHKIMTKPESTLICLGKALDILNVNGLLSVVSYLGQDRGKEHSIIKSFFESLDPRQFKVIDINPLNQDEMAPTLFLCQKVNETRD